MSLLKIPLRELRLGHYVCLPIEWKSHPFLRNNFKIRSSDELTVLKTLSLEWIDIDPEKSDLSGGRPSTPKNYGQPSATLKRTATPEALFQTQQKNSQRKSESSYYQCISQYRDTFAQFNSDPGAIYGLLKDLITHVSQAVFNQTNQIPQVYLILNDKGSDVLFSHSMNVMGLVLLMAKILHYSQKETETLALAAMISDIGLLRIPHQIRSKSQPLTKAELSFLQAHVGYSIDQLRKAQSIPNEVLTLVAVHHERRDGSGYPKGLTKDEFPRAAQILQVADYYDWLINPFPWQKPLSPQLAIAFLLKNSPDKFNQVIVEALANALGIYPPGTIVELSNQQLAIVAGSNPQNRLKPYIKRFGSDRFIDDLSFEDLSMLELSIHHSVPSEQLPESVTMLLANWRISYFIETESPG
ncbi:HD-GYP domain-containing protein [Celerinatantimonas sp. YJH-8]|uniref:HD-GYP domain-containing protein n=1 Tax=Celerinatantimonas sp. YJH-8 TaxID=3228714 RepID=UPI0038C07AC2